MTDQGESLECAQRKLGVFRGDNRSCVRERQIWRRPQAADGRLRHLSEDSASPKRILSLCIDFASAAFRFSPLGRLPIRLRLELV